MKIGITYLYTIFRYGYPPNPSDDFKALEDIEKDYRQSLRYLKRVADELQIKLEW